MLRPTAVRRFMWKQHINAGLPSGVTAAHWIAGKRVSAAHAGMAARPSTSPPQHMRLRGQLVPVESPSDAQPVFSFWAADDDVVRHALEPDSPSGAVWAGLCGADKAASLRSFAALLEANVDVLARAEAACTGLAVVDARRSVERARQLVMAAAERLGQQYNPQSVSLHPGMCLVTTGTAYPLEMGVTALMELLAPAAGHGWEGSLVWLPPPEAPLAVFALVELLSSGARAESSRPWLPVASVVSIVFGTNRTVDMLLEQPQVSRVVFHGVLAKDLPSRVQRQRRQGHHPGEERLLLERAGDDGVVEVVVRVPSAAQSGAVVVRPAAVEPVALRTAADIIRRTGLSHNGRANWRHPPRESPVQTVFVPPDALVAFLSVLVKDTLCRDCFPHLGHALDPRAHLGPLPSRAALETIRAAVASHSRAGLQQVCGGFPAMMPSGHFMMPCVWFAGDVRLEGKPGPPGDALDTMLRLQQELIEELGGAPMVYVLTYPGEVGLEPLLRRLPYGEVTVIDGAEAVGADAAPRHASEARRAMQVYVMSPPLSPP